MLILLALASPTLAQQAMPDFATIRKTDLAVIDRGNVEAWVNQQLQQLMTTANDDAALTLGKAFLDTISEHYKAADATQKFKDGLADIVTKSFLRQYKPAQVAPGAPRPFAVVYAMLVLKDMARATPDMIQAFTQAMSDPTPGARWAALMGLLQIRDQLTPAQWAALLPPLRQAGLAETNPYTLARLYQFLAVDGPQVPTVVPVVLDIMDAQLTGVEQKGGWPVAANAAAAVWLADRVAALNNPALENRVALQIGRLLANSVIPYIEWQLPPAPANPPPAAANPANKQPEPPKLTETQLEEIEKNIMTAEAQLVKILARRAANARPPSPDVRTTMLGGSKSGAAALMLALNGWIGTAQNAGALNAAPFNLERGLGIERTIATAPAATPAP